MHMSRWRFISALGTAALGGSVVGYHVSRFQSHESLPWTSSQRTSAASNLPAIVSDNTPMLPQSNNSASVVTARANDIARFGYPSFDSVRAFDDYILSYDRRNRTAHWVMEHLTASKLADRSKVNRSQSQFYSDMATHVFFRATNEDYKNSGYDRGHLAAAGNHWLSQESCNQTFILSNIAPQVGKGFNRDAWNRLEQYVRGLTKSYSNVWVCTGPLYLPSLAADGFKYVHYRVIGANHVAVPTHFFKAVLLENSGRIELKCWVLPNAVLPENVSLDQFVVPPDAIERASGLLLFQGVPRAQISKIN